MADTFYADGQYFNSLEEYQDYLEARYEKYLEENPWDADDRPDYTADEQQ